MDTLSITCPSCKTEIELTDALKDRMRSELSKDIAKQYEAKEKALKSKEMALSKQETNLSVLVEEKSKEAIQKAQEIANDNAKQKVESEITKLKASESHLKKSLTESKEREKDLLCKEQSLQEKLDDFDLELSRKVNQKTKEIRTSLEEKSSLEKQEKKLIIEQLTSQIKDLQQKAEQGSQQIQGEVLEVELESLLRTKFPMDVIENVAKGIKGGDVIHRVKNHLGEQVGVILYEAKRTKSFSAKWIPKLKADMLDYKVDLGVILTTVLPDDIKHIGEMSGVWITDYQSIVGLVSALRSQLLAIGMLKRNQRGRSEKATILYEYLVSNEFKQRIEAIATPFIEMQTSLAQEKRAMTRIWNTREKQIEGVLSNMAGFTGDIVGITGKQLTVPFLELIESS
jgi:hypothetical protein